ncbi:MAG: single-stranded-DNA-specific exonuclease RecJ [Saprospiraceae bacterium]|nr:MAG: single-stranded-DNA-specific exonuclease RecJ [Saprospiraceae bacterium]
MRKHWKLIPADEVEVHQLHEALHIHPVFCRLLVQRGIKTFDEAKAFFRPELSQLHDPFLMKDMDKAVTRLQLAIREKERILLYGDYDVDGTTSVALMYSFLSSRHANLDYYIPDRHKEGYGVSMQGVDYARQSGVTLIIAMDCGIQATGPVAKAKAAGTDFIICDHHLPGTGLPWAAAVLDPKREDCGYPFKELSGCGVAFKLAQAFLIENKEPEEELWQLLDLLALSIAADIVPMTGENRVLAYFGLQELNRTKRPGLKALIEQSGRPLPLSISDAVFGLAPLINAAGRLADAQQAVRLLLSGDKYVATDNARVLTHRNKLRKEFDQNILSEAKKQFEARKGWEDLRSIVLFQENWHQGVIGIAAARMVEHFHRPAILLTESNGFAVGSARSVPGFNIYAPIKVCEDLLINFGGHDHAAGLTLPIEAVPEFTRRFEEAVRERITEEQRIPEVGVSALLDLKDITLHFWKVLNQFAPFGPGNRSPIFVTKNVVDSGFSRVLKDNHLRLAIQQDGSPPVYGIAFGQAGALAKISKKKPFHVAYKLEENHWQGETTLRMVVKDLWI